MIDSRIVPLRKFKQDFNLETDESTIAVGAVIKQMFKKLKLEHPVAIFSRSLKKEWNYCAYEVEMYAVVQSVRNIIVILFGIEFLLRIDHIAFVRLINRDSLLLRESNG